jgi:chemotaxis protein CheD
VRLYHRQSADHAQKRIMVLLGGIAVAGEDTQLEAEIGACVAIVLWHEATRMGGMCHFMEPQRPDHEPIYHLDGLYGDEAIQILLLRACALGVHPRALTARIFGGAGIGQSVEPLGSSARLGAANIKMAERLLFRHGVEITSRHVGGHGHRSLRFDVATGKVQLHFKPITPQTAANYRASASPWRRPRRPAQQDGRVFPGS